MSQHPYGYGGYPPPPHGYQQYFQQQQQQQNNNQQQSQQTLPQIWHHQQQQQYIHKESRTLNTSMPGLLPPGISVVRDPPAFTQTALPPHSHSHSHSHSHPQKGRIQSSSSAPPPPLISKPQFTPSKHFPAPTSTSSTQGEHEMDTTTKPKQYKPLVKHFANRDELGFDLSRVKTEPDLLKGPPSLTLRPTPPPPLSVIPATSNKPHTSSSSLVSTTSSKTQVTQSTPVSGPSTLQEGGVPLSNSDSAAPHSSSLPSDVDDSRLEEKLSASKTREESSASGGSNNADSTLKIDTVNGEVEEGDSNVKHDELDEGLPDTASEPGHQSIDFFSNLKNAVVGKDTLCIFCIQNCFDKDPKLLNCLHTSCSSCLEKKFKEYAKHQRGEVVLDLEVGETIQSERSVFCPLCKIKTYDNEVAQNLIIVTADQNVEGEDSEGQVCNSCDEGNNSTQWCKDCGEYLCEDCVKAHQRVKMTKDHVLKLVLSTKKQLSSSSSSVPSLEAFKICSLHSNDYLDYYCDTCEKLSCRNCQLSPLHQGHSYRSSRDAVVDFKFKLRQIISDVKLKRNSLEENRALLKNKLIEVDIKEKSLLTQLKDVQNYLVHKIESRFKELIKEASQTILDKQKAINSRRSTLDRLFQQTEHSLAFVDHMLHFKSTEQYGEDLGILSAKRSVERQLRRLKKTDTSTGLTDQTNNFKLDAYFQQYSGAAMHEGLNSCLKQMLADVKVLNAPPQPPVEAKPPVATVVDTNILKTQKVVIKRAGESPAAPGARLAQRVSVAKTPSPLSIKRGGASAMRGAGRGVVSAANTGRGGGRGSSAKASPLSATRGGRGVSLASARGGGAMTRGAKTASNRGGRGGVARGGITNSIRAKTLAPNQVVGNLKGMGPGVGVASPRAMGRGTPSTSNPHQRIQQTSTTSPQLKAGVIPKQISILHQKNAQQQNVRSQPAVTSIHPQQGQKQTQGMASRPPVLQQMTQITVTPSNSNRIQQQQRWSSNNNARDWSQQQQRQQQLMQDQQQNSYFVAAYGQQATTVHPVNQQQRLARSVSTTNTNASSPNSSWHSPQVEETPSGPSHATNSSMQSDTSFKVALPSISKTSLVTSTPIKPTKSGLLITSVKGGVLDLNEASSPVEVVKNKSPEVSQSQKSPTEASTVNTNLENEKAPEKPSEKREPEPEPEPTDSDPLSVDAPSSETDNTETVSNPNNNKDEKSMVLEENLVAMKDEQGDSNSNTEAEDWCAICHDGGDVQYCCDRCPKVYHLYCYIPRLTDEPPDDWVCLMCATVDEIYQYSNAVEKGNMGERDLMISRRLLFELFNQYPQSSSFKDCADLNFPEYLEVVKEPIALDIIRDRLDVDNPDQYSRIEEFLSDVRRMFKNCYSFHDKESQWYQHAKELEEILDLKLEEWIPELAYDQTVITAKSKRKRSAAEVLPSSESEKESSSKKKKKKKADETVSNGNQDEKDEESESLSEGEKLDYLDNLEARLNRVKKLAEDDGSSSSKATTGGSKKGRGRGSRKGRPAIKLKMSK